MTKLKSNFKLIEGDKGAQVIPNYIAETFILKALCSIPKNIANITKKTLKSKPYVVLILSPTVYIHKNGKCNVPEHICSRIK